VTAIQSLALHALSFCINAKRDSAVTYESKYTTTNNEQTYETARCDFEAKLPTASNPLLSR